MGIIMSDTNDNDTTPPAKKAAESKPATKKRAPKKTPQIRTVGDFLRNRGKK